MFLFKRKKNAAKEQTSASQEQTFQCGLGIREGESGNYEVYQMQTDDIIMEAETYGRAEKAKIELDKIVNWNTRDDVYYDILTGEIDYRVNAKMHDIIDYYCVPVATEEEDDEEEEEEVQGYSVIEDEGDSVIVYVVKDGNGKEKTVRGERIVEGLAVRFAGKNEWTIDHIPSANMLTIFQTRKQAIQCTNAISDIVQWKQKNVMRLFSSVPDFAEYLKAVKKAVLNDKPIPLKPLSLLYKTEYFRLNIQNGDFERFSNAVDKLANMTGLKEIKQQVLDMIYTVAGKEMQKDRIKMSDNNLHMIFSGPPGTGKTEVARIMSDIFASLGYLEKGNLVEATRSTLVGENIGTTAPLVKQQVQEAMGGTLFIDEAYALVGDDQDFGGEAIDELIKQMEDNKGKFAVILAGYQADMERLMDMNEGFRSRVQYTFKFPDYTPEQVEEIIFEMLTSKGFIYSEEVEDAIRLAVKMKTKQGTVQGNARTARNIVENIQTQSQIRLAKSTHVILDDTHIIMPEDVKMATDEKAKNNNREELDSVRQKAQVKLKNLIGLKELKIEAERILNTIMVDNLRYENGMASDKTRMHMIFYGPPGTGKTTVARIMGEFLKGAGLLTNGHFIEVSRADLVAGYIGQTAEKVKKVVSKAMGGVLFIDEAYSLASGDDFGKEALDTLIKEMEDNADNLVVILAGYREDMQKLLALNEGLNSRVPYHFDFPHYSADELYQMTLMLLKNNYGLVPNEEAKEKLKAYIENKAENNGGFIKDDGRWARNKVEEIKINQSNRLANSGLAINRELLERIIVDDIPTK